LTLFKKIIYGFWAVCVLSLVVLFIGKPEVFEPANLQLYFEQFSSGILIIYILISIFRGIFLLPSTPFVLLGVLLFKDDPWLVFTISMIGIIITTIALYYFSDLLGFSKKLSSKYPEKMEKWKQRLNSPMSTLIVMAWSFFPLVPTDLICYVAGIVKMPFRFLLLGVIIGEAVLVYIYVFVGQSIVF
jgi:uncharacterized membrane protein YdjX (TVP38/TMEM64 family)